MKTYFHAGPKGLKVILPPQEQVARNIKTVNKLISERKAKTGEKVCSYAILSDPSYDKVCLYQQWDQGKWIADWIGGCVYEVFPQNVRYDDEVGCYVCDRAVVHDVVYEGRLSFEPKDPRSVVLDDDDLRLELESSARDMLKLVETGENTKASTIVDWGRRVAYSPWDKFSLTPSVTVKRKDSKSIPLCEYFADEVVYQGHLTGIVDCSLVRGEPVLRFYPKVTDDSACLIARQTPWEEVQYRRKR